MSKLKLAIIIAILAPASTAFAGTESVSTHDGSNSVNSVRIEVNKETKVDVDNDADIHNAVDLEVNTGVNEVEDNEGDVSIDTGNADASVDVENVVNTTDIKVGPCKEEEEKEEEEEEEKPPVTPPAEAGGAAGAEEQLALAAPAQEAALEGFGGGPLAEAGAGLGLLFGVPSVAVAIRRIRDLAKK